jgi:hypothetical protein
VPLDSTTRVPVLTADSAGKAAAPAPAPPPPAAPANRTPTRP